MKKMIIAATVLALAGMNLQTAKAGQRDWAIAGGILTGVAVGAAIAADAHPVYVAPAPVYCPAPAVVYTQPVVCAPAPVVYAPTPVVVYGPRFAYYPRPYLGRAGYFSRDHYHRW